MLAGLIGLAATLWAKPGDLDLGYGGTGFRTFEFGLGTDQLQAMEWQPDDQLVVAGLSSSHAAYSALSGSGNSVSLIRFREDGSLDTEFGVQGEDIRPRLPTVSYSTVTMTILRDGKILVAAGSNSFTSGKLVVARCHKDGSLDDTFGAQGIVELASDSQYLVRAAKELVDGRILIAGENVFTAIQARLTCLQADGSPDPTFGQDGVVRLSGRSQARELAIQDDGRILLAGARDSEMAVWRFESHGAPDTTFNGSGVFSLPLGNSMAEAVVIQPAGFSSPESDPRILLAGRTGETPNEVLTLAGLTMDGRMDSAFGDEGIVTTILGQRSAARAMVLHAAPDQSPRLSVAGLGQLAGEPAHFFVWQYHLDGSLVDAFAGDGTIKIPMGQQSDPTALVSRDGKLTVAGTSQNGRRFSDFAIARCDASTGALDPTFGETGSVLLDIGGAASTLSDLLLEPDGKLVLAGESYWGIQPIHALVRWHPDGRPDWAFGTLSRTFIRSADAPAGVKNATAVARQPDGALLLAGRANHNGTKAFLVARYRPDGQPDLSFNQTGSVVTNLGPGDEEATDMVVQPDGKIVVAGIQSTGSTAATLAVVRYRPNGSLDTDFTGDGMAGFSILGNYHQNARIALWPDGRLLLGATCGTATEPRFGLLCLLPDGTPDPNFGENGRATEAFSGQASALDLVVQGDGKIVQVGAAGAAANGPRDFALIRYLPDGQPDPAFGDQGRVLTPIGDADDLATCVAMQSDGKLLVAGRSGVLRFLRTALARYRPDGTLDTSFGVGGKVITFLGLENEETATAVAIDAHGRAIVGGFAGPLLTADARYAFVAHFHMDNGTEDNWSIDSISPLAAGQFRLEGQGPPNQTGTLESSTTLLPESFTPLGSVLPGPEGRWSFEDSTTPSPLQRYYRLRIP